MNLVESKAYGIPAVIYSMPYLEMLKDGRGYISVERHNIVEAVEAVNLLVRDANLRQQYSEEARQSYLDFIKNLPSHIDSWNILIKDLEKGVERRLINDSR